MNIDHLSVSHANEFIERRARWFASRVLGYNFDAGPKALRGKAVEAGVDEWTVTGGNAPSAADDAVAVALAAFDAGADDMPLDEAQAERDILPALVREACKQLLALTVEHGRVVNRQMRLEDTLMADGAKWIGFTDYTLAGGLIVDLKTKGKSVPSIPRGEERQGAFYHYSLNNLPVAFIYVWPLKSGAGSKVIMLDEACIQSRLNELREAERAITSLLRRPDIRELALAFLPDRDHYSFSDMAPVARDIWGMS